jgi:hypothetical protein
MAAGMNETVTAMTAPALFATATGAPSQSHASATLELLRPVE